MALEAPVSITIGATYENGVLKPDALRRDASPEQRNHWRLIGPGTGIHWPEIDEDISVTRLFGLPC